MPVWLAVQGSKIDSVQDSYELSPSHLRPATSIIVVDCCQFGPSWMFGLKMELMACADLVGGTSEQSCIFSPNIQLGQNLQQSTTIMDVARLRCDDDSL